MVRVGPVRLAYARYFVKISTSIIERLSAPCGVCKSIMCLAILSSRSFVGISLTTNIRSNLVSSGIGRLTFSVIFLNGSYFPYIGFAAARIEVLAFSVATIPPFAMLADCCSITS